MIFRWFKAWQVRRAYRLGCEARQGMPIWTPHQPTIHGWAAVLNPYSHTHEAEQRAAFRRGFLRE